MSVVCISIRPSMPSRRLCFLGQKDTPVDRVKWVLERLNNAHVSKEGGSELEDNTKKLLHKFMQQVETIFWKQEQSNCSTNLLNKLSVSSPEVDYRKAAKGFASMAAIRL